MKKSIMLVLCLAVLPACKFTDAKPQGSPTCESTPETVTDRCCNNCKPCRASFNVEKPVDPACPRTKNYEYNVQVIDPPCLCEQFDTLDANVEKPKDPPCPKKLNLSTRVEHNPKDCDCPLCRYGNLSNITLNREEHYCTNKSHHRVLNQHKFYEFRSVKNSIHEENYCDHCFRRKRIKRLASDEVTCNDLVKCGYICRCVPEDESGVFSATSNGDPIVGSPFREDFDETDVYVGGGRPPSYEVIRRHITPILVAQEGLKTAEELRGLAEIYYEIYKRHNEKNLTIPMKYGTKMVETDEEGLRTYDIEPVDGQYVPSTGDKLAHISNHMFGQFVDHMKKMQQFPRLSWLGFRQNRQSRRTQRNSKRKESQRDARDLT